MAKNIGALKARKKVLCDSRAMSIISSRDWGNSKGTLSPFQGSLFSVLYPGLRSLSLVAPWAMALAALSALQEIAKLNYEIVNLKRAICVGQPEFHTLSKR